MNHNIIGAAAAGLLGMAVAFVNYLFSKKILQKAPEKYSLVTVLRQILQIAFLALAYFIGTRTQLADPVYLMVGAVIGMTVPMLFFTKKLLLINKSTVSHKNEKGTDTDG